MSWINRCIVRTGSALALLLAVTLAGANAAQRPTVLFQRAPLPVTHLVNVNGKWAIGVQDAGFRALLRDVGAALTWKPGDRYVLITTAQPQIVSFAVGDTRYDVGPVQAQAAFAPFEQNGDVYLPLDEMLRGLSLAARGDAKTIVIQPQLDGIDVQSSGGRTQIVARAGIALRPRLLTDSPDRLVFAFDGVGTTLGATRDVHAAGVRDIRLNQSGTVSDPVTTVTIDLETGATHGQAGSDDGRDFTLALAGSGTTPAIASVSGPPAAVAAAATPPLETPPSPTAGPSAVTAVTGEPSGDGYTVHVATTGTIAYDWHRLRPPDNRFWIDLHGATLQMPPYDQQGSGPVSAIRARQVDPNTVRVALSLMGTKQLTITPDASGVTIAVSNLDAGDDIARTGSGSVGSNAGNAAVAAQPGEPNDAGWKFAPRGPAYVAQNPRLIVIDPGHGGSDPGSMHGRWREADLTLDMAKRLRDVLVARGWEVKMTRTTDVDVYKPDDSAREELQARDDVANKAGARMFVSIHVNSFINAGPRGTTTYYSKPSDVPLARAVQNSAISELGTHDDGIVKSKLYVTLHADMPAVLIETAFLSNPDDLSLLASPDWRQKMAVAIADGISKYAGAPPSSGQLDPQ